MRLISQNNISSGPTSGSIFADPAGQGLSRVEMRYELDNDSDESDNNESADTNKKKNKIIKNNQNIKYK